MKRYVTCPFAAARLMRLPLLPPSAQLPQLPVRQPPSPPSPQLPQLPVRQPPSPPPPQSPQSPRVHLPQLPPCTDKPFATLSALGFPGNCTAGLSKGAGLFGILSSSVVALSGGSAEAGVCALTMASLSVFGPLTRNAIRNAIRDTTLASTDPFATVCPEACGAYGVYAPGCSPPSSKPSQPPQPPPQPPKPPTSQQPRPPPSLQPQTSSQETSPPLALWALH